MSEKSAQPKQRCKGVSVRKRLSVPRVYTADAPKAYAHGDYGYGLVCGHCYFDDQKGIYTCGS